MRDDEKFAYGRIVAYRHLGGRFRKRNSTRVLVLVLVPMPMPAVVPACMGWRDGGSGTIGWGGWLTDYAWARNSVLNGLAVGSKGCRGNFPDHHFSPKRPAYAGPSLHSAIIEACGRRWGPLRIREEIQEGETSYTMEWLLVDVDGKEGGRKDCGSALRLVLDGILQWRCSSLLTETPRLESGNVSMMYSCRYGALQHRQHVNIFPRSCLPISGFRQSHQHFMYVSHHAHL